MEKIIKMLMSDIYKHVYVVRGIIQNIDDFQMIVIKENPLEYLAIWTHDLAITYYNENSNSNEILRSYIGNYEFVDLNQTIGSLLLNDDSLNIASFYHIRRYYLMGFLNTHNISFALPETMRELSVKRVYSKNNTKHVFKSSDGIEIGSVVIEDITKSLKAISNLYVSDQLRNMGYAKAIMYAVLNEYQDCDLILYVEENNSYAIHLYDSFGFKILDKYMNFELKGGEI